MPTREKIIQEGPFYSITFKQAIGLMYSVVCTKPDLTITVCKLLQILEQLTTELWMFAKRVLRFVKGTTCHSITIKACSDKPVAIGYCSSDWAGCILFQESASVFANFLAWGAVWRKCEKRSIVKASNAEGEYIVLRSVLQEYILLARKLAFAESISMIQLSC